MKKKSEPRRLRGLDAHHRLAYGAVAGVIAFFLGGQLLLATRFLVGWDVFSLVALILAWIILGTEDPYEVRRNAGIQDSSMTFLFTVVISAAMISLLAVGVLLDSTKSKAPVVVAQHVGVSVATIILSWALVHTMFALRYAHLFYSNAREKGREHAVGGLNFPGNESPDYLDFAYFSFVIGMTCQVSDVGVTSRDLRRLALVHGLISFCFNTAILAMFVNIVASLV